jgi:hypothetical protein
MNSQNTEGEFRTVTEAGKTVWSLARSAFGRFEHTWTSTEELNPPVSHFHRKKVLSRLRQGEGDTRFIVLPKQGS